MSTLKLNSFRPTQTEIHTPILMRQWRKMSAMLVENKKVLSAEFTFKTTERSTSPDPDAPVPMHNLQKEIMQHMIRSEAALGMSISCLPNSTAPYDFTVKVELNPDNDFKALDHFFDAIRFKDNDLISAKNIASIRGMAVQSFYAPQAEKTAKPELARPSTVNTPQHRAV